MHHFAVVWNAAGRVLHLDQGMSAFNDLEVSLVVHFGSYVGIITRNLGKGCEYIELGHHSGDLLEQRVVS